MDTFVSWNDAGKKVDYIQMLDFVDLTILNTICPTYHSLFGYHLDEHVMDKYEVSALRFKTIPGLVKTVKQDKEVCATVNLEKAEKYARKSQLTHKTVVIRLQPRPLSGWENKPEKVSSSRFGPQDLELAEPVYWYEFPLTDQDGYSYLQPLSARPYIHVTDPFDEVEIRSEEKDHRITIDDILFASRALCTDDTRGYEQYHVISDNGSTLVLMVNIDNFYT